MAKNIGMKWGEEDECRVSVVDSFPIALNHEMEDQVLESRDQQITYFSRLDHVVNKVADLVVNHLKDNINDVVWKIP